MAGAACENKFNKLWVQSTYLTKNKEDVTQATTADNTDHDTHARSALVSPSSDINVSQNEPDVKNIISKNSANNSVLQSSANEGNLQNSALRNNVQSDIINNSSDNATLSTPKYSEEQHESSIMRYKSGESYMINAKLREGVELEPDEQEFVDTLDEALQQLPTYEGTVYRNLVFDDFGGKEAFDEFVEQYTPGDIIVYDQFISCSTKIDGYPVEGDFKVQLIIESKTAHDVDGYGNNMESEVLYSTTSVFIVDKIQVEANTPKIYLKEAQINGYDTIEEQSDAMFNMQESHSRDSNLQSVSESNTVGNLNGQIRPQSTASAGQRDTVRSSRRQGTVLPAESQEQIRTQADLDNGPASFMPENDSSDSGEMGFREPDVKGIYRKSTDEETAQGILTGKRLDNKMRHINDIAKKLDSGMKIIWCEKNSDKLHGKNGKYVRETNTMYIAKDIGIAQMYHEVFKHEFVHRLESKKAYQSFEKYLFEKSVAFENYARAQLKLVNPNKVYETRTDVLDDLVEEYLYQVKNDNSLPLNIRKDFDWEDAKREVVADFVGETLFKGKENRADMAQALSEFDSEYINEETTEKAVEGFLDAANKDEGNLDLFGEMATDNRNLLQKVIDAIKDFINNLKHVPQNKSLVEDLEYIEQRLSRVYASKDTKKAADMAPKVQFRLGSYSEHQLANWSKSHKIVIYRNEKSLLDFVEKAITEPNYKAKMYFGTVTKELADRIYTETGLDLFGRNVTLRADNIRKILKPESHGDAAREKKKKQVAVEKTDFNKIEAVIGSPDLIKLSDTEYEGKPAVKFAKVINEQIVTVIAVDSGGSLDLFVQTLYIGKKNRNIASMLNGNTDEQTSETTAGTVPTNKIPHIEDSVKNNISEDSENYSEKGQMSLGSPSQQARENLDKYERGEMTREEYLEANDELWGKANEEYGMLPQGENAQAPIATPKAVAEDKPTERFTRTIIETGKLSEEMLQGMEEKVLLGDFAYKPISDEVATKTAQAAINNGTAEDIWNDAVNVGKRFNKNQIAIGEQLLADAIKNGDTKRVLELSAELADVFVKILILKIHFLLYSLIYLYKRC